MNCKIHNLYNLKDKINKILKQSLIFLKSKEYNKNCLLIQTYFLLKKINKKKP